MLGQESQCHPRRTPHMNTKPTRCPFLTLQACGDLPLPRPRGGKPRRWEEAQVPLRVPERVCLRTCVKPYSWVYVVLRL